MKFDRYKGQGKQNDRQKKPMRHFHHMTKNNWLASLNRQLDGKQTFSDKIPASSKFGFRAQNGW